MEERRKRVDEWRKKRAAEAAAAAAAEEARKAEEQAAAAAAAEAEAGAAGKKGWSLEDDEDDDEPQQQQDDVSVSGEGVGFGVGGGAMMSPSSSRMICGCVGLCGFVCVGGGGGELVSCHRNLQHCMQRVFDGGCAAAASLTRAALHAQRVGKQSRLARGMNGSAGARLPHELGMLAAAQLTKVCMLAPAHLAQASAANTLVLCGCCVDAG